MTIGLSAMNSRSACDELRDKVQADHMTVHPDQLEIPELRLRKIEPKTIRELAESIQEVGLLEPIGVKHSKKGNRYTVIYGARRALAFQLLHREAMEKASDPNTDQDVFRYTQIQVMRYRNEIPDEVCQEMEIRENLDRKELKSNERRAHTLQLGAITQIRFKKRKKLEAKESIGIVGQNGQQFPNGRGRPSSVTSAVAEKLGTPRKTIDNRVKASSEIVRAADPETFTEDLSLDKTPPAKLQKAAEILLKTPSAMNQAKKDRPPSLGQETTKGRRLTLDLYPVDAPAFAEWMRKRHPASFSLDDIRAYRDALVDLVKELERE